MANAYDISQPISNRLKNEVKVLEPMKDKRYLAYASYALAALFGYLETFHVELTNDTNYYMHCAWRLWKYGPWKLYSLCFDENFPYHTALYTPLAGFAATFHIDPAIVLHMTCCICCIICMVVLSRVMKAHGIDSDDRHLWLATVAFTLLVVPSMYGVFADREHFLFIFGLPWMFQMIMRVKPLTYTAFMAAVGFLMKPHDYALFGILTLLAGPAEWSLTQRIFSVSSLIMGCAGVLYVALIWIFFPDFIYQVLPLSLVVYPTKYYTAFYKFSYALKYIAIAGVTALAFASPQAVKRSWLAFIAGCTAVLFLNAGWDYTFYLCAVPMVLAFALPWIHKYGGAEQPRGTMVRTVLFLICGMMAMSAFSIGTEMGVIRQIHFRNHNTVLPELRAQMQKDAGDKIIVLSVNVWNSQVEPFGGHPEAVFGYDNIWTYFWLGAREGDPNYPMVRDSMTNNFLETITKNPTAVIFADISPQPVITPDGPLGFLMRDARIREQMKHYSLVKDINYCSKDLVVACRFAELKRLDVQP